MAGTAMTFEEWWEDPQPDGPPPAVPVAKETASWIWAAAVAAERERWEALRAIGTQLANVAFNWSQEENGAGARLTEGERATLKALQQQWDKARRA